MRLSADVLGMAEQRTNPLGERELVLRGLGIPVIEHLAATRDLFDAIDFADNRLMTLGNFPRLLRLSSLSVTGNLVETIDVTNLRKNLPNLKFLNLTDNRIRGLHQATNIAKACPHLEQLTLHHNPVTQKQHYRLYVINKLPKLKVLDFVKVKKAERDRAKRLAQSAAGAALEGDVKLEGRQNKNDSEEKTFYPGEGNSAQESFVTQFTSQQKVMIRTMIANATSPADIERIEASVQKGIFPSINNETTATTVTNSQEDKISITHTPEESKNRKRTKSSSADDEPKEAESPARRTRSRTATSSK